MPDLARSFDARVDRSGDHHLWTGATDPLRGTGRLKVAGKSVTAHRVAWELAHGLVPAGAKVIACPDEPACVRVDHLRCDGGERSRRRRAKKGDGSVREVRPGTWQLSVTADGVGGRRRIHSTVRANSRREASQALAAFVEEVGNAAPVPEPEIYAQTFDQAVETFLTEHLLGEKGREERTVSDYRKLHLKWFSPALGRRLARDVDEAAIDDVFGQMRAAGLSRSRMNQPRASTSRSSGGPTDAASPAATRWRTLSCPPARRYRPSEPRLKSRRCARSSPLPSRSFPTSLPSSPSAPSPGCAGASW